MPASADAEICECECPDHFCSGVPGIIARMENGRLAPGAAVERCDACGRYPSDGAADAKLVELGLADSLLHRALEQFVSTIDTTGGIKRDRKGCFVPAIDEEWIDLADAYLMACRALGREPHWADEAGDETDSESEY